MVGATVTVLPKGATELTDHDNDGIAPALATHLFGKAGDTATKLL